MSLLISSNNAKFSILLFLDTSWNNRTMMNCLSTHSLNIIPYLSLNYQKLVQKVHGKKYHVHIFIVSNHVNKTTKCKTLDPKPNHSIYMLNLWKAFYAWEVNECYEPISNTISMTQITIIRCIYCNSLNQIHGWSNHANTPNDKTLTLYSKESIQLQSH
jgi:hypothetical protein